MKGTITATSARVCAAAIAIAVVASAACASRAPSDAGHDAAIAAPIGSVVALGGEGAARVGSTAISKVLVHSVASDQHLDARAAVTVLIDEALLAEAARRSLASQSGAERRHVETRLAAAEVRKLLAESIASARARGAPTADEYARAMGNDWSEIDVGESRSSSHALIKKEVPDFADRCIQLQKALAGAKDDADFTARANAFSLPDDKHPIVESLPFSVADGRVVSRDPMAFEGAYTKALFSLAAVGDQTGPTMSSYGCHIIRLSEIHPPKRISDAEMSERLDPRVMRERALPDYEKLVAKLRADAHVDDTVDETLLVAPHFYGKLGPLAATESAPPSAP